jgi:hypothetical protein
VPNLHLMALNVTGGPLEFDAVVNIDEGLKNVNKLGDAFNSIGDKTKKNTFIDSFVQSLKENIKSLGTQVTDIKSKIKELESQPIGKQDFQGIKNLNDQLKQTETAVQFLTQLTDNLGELPKSFNESTTGAGRLQTQLRVLRDDLAKLKVEGKDASPEFASKLEEATHLEHALHNVNKELELQASNVAGVEALKQGFQGLIGGAEAFAGAMGLITNDREQAEVIIKNLISLQSILNGVEEIGVVLDKNSALNVYLLGLQRKFAGKAAIEQAAGTEVMAAAEAEGVAATEAATVAQVELNAAMLANPVGAILVGIVALYGAYEILSNTLFKASDAERSRAATQKALQEAEDKAADATAEEEGKLNILIATAKNKILSDEKRIDAISVLRSQYPQYLSNLSLENVYTKEASEAIEKQIDLIKAKALAQAAEQVYIDSLKEQIKARNALNEAVTKKSGFFDFSDPIGKVKDLQESTEKVNGAFTSFKDIQDDLAKKMGNSTDEINSQALAWENMGESIKSASVQINSIINQGVTSVDKILKDLHKQFDQKDFDASKKRITELYQYEVDKTREGTTANLKTRLDMQKALLAYEKTNPILFQNGNPVSELIDPKAHAEALKILGDLQKGITGLNDQLTETALQNATAGANALVLALQAAGLQGSEKYFNAQAVALKKAAIEQIVQAKDNAGKIREINAKLQLDLVNLDKERQKQQLENEKSILQTRLNFIKQGTDEELQLRLQMIDVSTKEELLQVGKNQDKINEINSTAEKSKADLRKKFAIEVAETETNIRIAQIETQLAAVQSGTDEELNLKKQLIDQKAKLDIQEKTAQIKNERLLAATIGEINAQTLRDKRKLEDDFVNDLLSRQFKLFDQQESSNNLKNDFVINDPRSTNTQKANAELDKLQAAGLKLQKEINAISNQIASNRGDITVLGAQLDELQNKQDQNKNDQAIQKFKVTLAELDDMQKRATAVSASFKSMADGVGIFNQGLGQALGTLSQMADSASGLVKSLAEFQANQKKNGGSGDFATQLSNVSGIVSALVTAAKIIRELFNEVKKKITEATATINDFNAGLITGEQEYQAMLRDRERQTVLLNKLTIDGLKAQQDLLEKQKKTNQQAFDDLLAQLQKETFVKGKTLDSNVLNLLFGKDSAAKDITASLAGKTFDQLQELFTKGELVGRAKDLFEQLQKLKQEGVDIDQQLVDLKEKAAETFTGTTAAAITDALAQGFADGKRFPADFAGDFEDMLRAAIINSLKFKYLEGPVKDLFDQFAASTESGGQLTKQEIEDLRNKYNAIIKNAGAQFDQLQQIAGLNFASTSTTQQNTLTGAFRTMSEDTGNLLAGQFGAVRIAQLQLVDVAKISNNHLYAIETNTFNTVVELRTVVSILRDSVTGAARLKVTI